MFIFIKTSLFIYIYFYRLSNTHTHGFLRTEKIVSLFEMNVIAIFFSLLGPPNQPNDRYNVCILNSLFVKLRTEDNKFYFLMSVSSFDELYTRMKDHLQCRILQWEIEFNVLWNVSCYNEVIKRENTAAFRFFVNFLRFVP